MHPLIPREKKYPCKDARDVDYYIRKVLDSVDLDNTALFLSGGIDSAILASYLPRGSNVYTVRAQIGTPADESKQAKIYADINNLKQTVIDVTWDDYKGCIDRLMLRDGSPIIPNEPQCYMMARKAVEDGNRIVLYGDAADTEFGGMDLLLAKDWSYNEWIERFTFVKPIALKDS